MSSREPRLVEPVRLEPAILDRMIAVRRHLHANPELSNEERETQSYLRRALSEMGIEGVRDVAGFGLAVDIVGTAAPSNRKVVVRVDIDALPIEEETDLPFRSRKPGVMHACGHDAHAAMGVALAASLHQARADFRGTVRIIFQPAEEAEPLGGRRVVEEGLLDDVDGAFGIHVDPGLETGRIAVAAGPYTLACDTFDAVIDGMSAHAAMPAAGVDTIAIACAIVGELQKIVAREIDPYDPLVVSVTGIEGGGAYNVLAPRVCLKGTIRSGSDATRLHAWQRVRDIMEGVAGAHRAQATLTVTKGEPGVVNDAEMTRIVQESAVSLFGSERVVQRPGWTAADDFGYYSEKVGSCYFRLGIANRELGSGFPLHHPRFAVDEAALEIGVATLAEASRRFLDVE